MSVAALPDAVGGVISRLGSFAEILALVTTSAGYIATATPAQLARPRISGRVQSFWQLGRWPATPTDPKGSYAIAVSGPIGSPLDDRDGAVYGLRTDLHLYGSSPMEAMALWRQVHPCLCPRLHRGVPEQFTASGCRFLTVDVEGGPISIVEPDTRFCKVVAPYVFRWQELY